MDTISHADITQMLTAANAAVSAGAYAQAQTLLRQTVEIDEECVEAWWLLGERPLYVEELASVLRDTQSVMPAMVEPWGTA